MIRNVYFSREQFTIWCYEKHEKTILEHFWSSPHPFSKGAENSWTWLRETKEIKEAWRWKVKKKDEDKVTAIIAAAANSQMRSFEFWLLNKCIGYGADRSSSICAL